MRCLIQVEMIVFPLFIISCLERKYWFVIEKEELNCSWCNLPGAQHEGGGELKSVPISGVFCDKDCFRLWINWNFSWESFLLRREEKKKEQSEKKEEI